MGKIRDKIAERRTSKKGFDEIQEALLRAIRGILEPIDKDFTINIEITCKIAGVGATAIFEHSKKDIPSDDNMEDENTKKLEEFLKKLLSKAQDRIKEVLNSKNLVSLEFSAGTESIPTISWISNVNFKVTINLK